MVFKIGIWNFLPRREVGGHRTEIKNVTKTSYLLFPVTVCFELWESVPRPVSFCPLMAMALLPIFYDPQFFHFFSPGFLGKNLSSFSILS